MLLRYLMNPSAQYNESSRNLDFFLEKLFSFIQFNYLTKETLSGLGVIVTYYQTMKVRTKYYQTVSNNVHNKNTSKFIRRVKISDKLYGKRSPRLLEGTESFPLKSKEVVSCNMEAATKKFKGFKTLKGISEDKSALGLPLAAPSPTNKSSRQFFRFLFLLVQKITIIGENGEWDGNSFFKSGLHCSKISMIAKNSSSSSSRGSRKECNRMNFICLFLRNLGEDSELDAVLFCFDKEKGDHGFGYAINEVRAAKPGKKKTCFYIGRDRPFKNIEEILLECIKSYRQRKIFYVQGNSN
ncbi:hypothetical protein H8356DRAFT_1359241 [Neocallimastix lanati (nom. inval.)]|nr:hypothetical protein H8356DRAFT_1359241 [Neocallimastix sp. JGI-2020a]